jgi:haloalkane dehalogenase
MKETESRPLPSWVDRDLYPFTGCWLALPGEGAIHYLDEGPAEGVADPGSARVPTIVFVHGTPTWSIDWRRLVAAFAPTHRCLAIDHLGFGMSERPWGADYTPEGHARRFRAWMEALDLTDVTLVVHDFGGPIALPMALEQPGRVSRLVVLNSWMWSFEGDPHIEKGSRILGGALGRWLYRSLNFSLKVITPSAYADKKKLGKPLHAQLLAPFTGIDSRERVLWTLARSLLGSSAFYADLWERRGALAALPALIVWGAKDPAFLHRYLARWREALPRAGVLELPVGHWPQEEAPAEVERALSDFLAAG